MTQDTSGTPYTNSDITFDALTPSLDIDDSMVKTLSFYVEAALEASVAYM